MPVVCYRVEKAQNVLPGGSVEAIREACVRSLSVGRQFDLGIVHDQIPSALDAELTADLHRNPNLIFHLDITHVNSISNSSAIPSVAHLGPYSMGMPRRGGPSANIWFNRSICVPVSSRSPAPAFSTT